MLGNSSGFQSYQYRAVEFILGNKNAALLAVFRSRPEAQAMLAETLESPTVYDAFLRFLARRGHPVPPRSSTGTSARSGRDSGLVPWSGDPHHVMSRAEAAPIRAL